MRRIEQKLFIGKDELPLFEYRITDPKATTECDAKDAHDFVNVPTVNGIEKEVCANCKANKMHFTTMYLLQQLIDNYPYKNRADQKAADKIFIRLNVEKDDEGECINLEDAEYELLHKMTGDFEPYISRRLFVPFLDLFDVQ